MIGDVQINMTISHLFMFSTKETDTWDSLYTAHNEVLQKRKFKKLKQLLKKNKK